MKIRDITTALERFAPLGLALEWDNVGLLLGDAGQEVERVLVTLDVTRAAVDKAVRTGCRLVVSHHPLFLKPLARINNPLILRLARHGIAVYCAHTNLDVARGGVNHALAARLGLRDCILLSHESGAEPLHVAVYVPSDAAQRVADAVHEAGAGVMGNYSHCLNSYPVDGRFRPLEGAHPAVGSVGKMESVREDKLEFFCDTAHLDAVLSAMRSAHPYETPAYAVYPQRRPDPNHGLGLVGELSEPMTLRGVAELVRERLGAPVAQLWPAGQPEDKLVRRVAVCGGSGGTLTRAARAAGAEVFVLGESNYHGMLDSSVPLVLAGHFHTENPIVPVLAARLRELELNVEELTAAEHEIDRLRVIT
ncbi:MAG: Nif3-like dinuclear metal center hexameric protein [Candidatus Cloacimonetes bacterium]|nr:Nif3-like dinuclear metal center hexameric protein [Candidatus Cloacimonadota bacterium]